MRADGATTEDRLLGGRVVLRQPATGYRAAIDPVLLAASVPAKAGETVLDLGTGTGAAALCLIARVDDVSVVGIEIAPEIAALAETNAALNGAAERFHIVVADVEARGGLGADSFDHVMANPPFHDDAVHPPSPVTSKARANTGAAAGLATWLGNGVARLRPGGTLSVIQRADRLGDILAALEGKAGRIVIQPIAPRAGAPAGRVIVQAVKGRRTPLALLAPLVMHDTDGSYTASAERILSKAVPLSLAP